MVRERTLLDVDNRLDGLIIDIFWLNKLWGSVDHLEECSQQQKIIRKIYGTLTLMQSPAGGKNRKSEEVNSTATARSEIIRRRNTEQMHLTPTSLPASQPRGNAAERIPPSDLTLRTWL
ncbi:hypothetical protein HNY73_013202 [Argiope bruennichi]|uniref:Uncharacterized protein n=1 Tax=Argiope bruennichi TaxID=94029 RepID=A0A8T0F1X5_ARGBR|nr:hypothetical protein HNY73_013202 [Argiope bruennichi]